MARCGSCGGNRSTAPFRVPASSPAARTSGAAAQAGSSTMYEVLTARGTPTGRRFSSLVAASGYARRIGGSTQPVE